MACKVIGIVGPIACGKGVVVDYLKKTYGYSSFSLSTILHDELHKKGAQDFTRTTLQDLGDELRKKEGDGVLAMRAIAKLKMSDRPCIIEGIRNPGEVKYLRTIKGFFLIAVDAPQQIRFKRLIQRAKPWDPKDWESFLKVDGRDGGDGEKANGQQVQKCMRMADVTIQNTGTIAQVHKKVSLLSRLLE